MRMSWDGFDRHRRFGVLAVVGLLAGAGMAVFGLPPVPLHSPLRLVGMVCPLCGATRAVQALMRGDLATAWSYNPIAFIVVPVAVLLLIRWVIGLAVGRWPNVLVTRPRMMWSMAGVVAILLWTNQAMHAELLRSGDGGFVSQLAGLAVAAAFGGIATLAYLVALRPLVQRFHPAENRTHAGAADHSE